MTRFFTVLMLVSMTLPGCSEFQSADKKAQPPVTVSGATYEVYLLSRNTSNDPSDPRNMEETVRAYYAKVGAGATVYCGASYQGCAAAIRRFNQDKQRSEEHP